MGAGGSISVLLCPTICNLGGNFEKIEESLMKHTFFEKIWHPLSVKDVAIISSL